MRVGGVANLAVDAFAILGVHATQPGAVGARRAPLAHPELRRKLLRLAERIALQIHLKDGEPGGRWRLPERGTACGLKIAADALSMQHLQRESPPLGRDVACHDDEFTRNSRGIAQRASTQRQPPQPAAVPAHAHDLLELAARREGRIHGGTQRLAVLGDDAPEQLLPVE
jgi:hypothetical protein